MPSDEKTRITEFPFTQGQNEGVERSVLPIGQFSYLQNVRYRKTNRLGKRNGYTVKTSLDANGAALGSGPGRLACLGPEFCVVDDRFYRRNVQANTWTLPAITTGAQSRSLSNRFPQCMPGPILDTTIQESLAAAQPQEAGLTYALGYMWTAEARALNAAGWVVHVDAIDPATSAVVFSQEIALAAAVNTDTPHVQLLVTQNGAVVLCTDSFTAGAKSGFTWHFLTTLTAGFGASQTTACVESAVNYCTAPGHPDSIVMLRVLTGALTTTRFSYLNVLTGLQVSDLTYAVGGNKTLLSVFQGVFQNIVRGGWLDATGPTVVCQTRSVAMGLVATQSVSALVGSQAPLLFAERSLGTVAAILSDTAGTALYNVDVDSAGLLVVASVSYQLNMQAISWPFTDEGRVYIWVRYLAGEGLGVASLVRVAGATEYASATTPGIWPLQATVDDRDVDAPLPVRTAGPPLAAPLATPLGYVALLNYTRESYVGGGGITSRLRSYALVPVLPRSGGVRYSPSCVVPCQGRHFVASAQPMWVDRIAAYEAGFVQAPLIISTTPAGGGSLTASSTYSWTLIFQSADGSGNERSGTALPATVALAVGETRCTLVVTTHDTGARRQIAARLYRTLSNGTEFFFVREVDATPGLGVGTVSIIDTAADTDIEQNEKLYTQVGLELDATNFPACSFANTGGQRLWCAGGFNAATWHCSKRFLPHLVPEFADDDAFRGTLPEAITGSAWLDSQVFFTQESVYIVGGDGPDGSGVGFFTTTRLPFSAGCIDWRSVVACDVGVFFQSPRSLYLLPRGFGAPVAMDQVLDTLTAYPIITSARTDYRSRGGADSSEQIVQWTAVADEEATSGVVITYDLAYQTFSIDTFSADYPATFAAGWSGDEVLAPASTLVGPGGAGSWHPFRVRDTSYSDGGLPIAMLLRTGAMRLWGTFGYGVIHRLGLLGELRSACTLYGVKTTDRGARTAVRLYTGIAPDPVPGSPLYLSVDLGSTEQKDVTALMVELNETSATEGVAWMGFVIEHDNEAQNFRRPSLADRIT